MKILNKLIIEKSQIYIIDPEIIINDLILKDLEDYNDPFILKNKDYILNKPISKYWFYLIRDFKSSLNKKEINNILKLIINNSDYSLKYAVHLKKRFKEGRFKEGEVAISMNGNNAVSPSKVSNSFKMGEFSFSLSPKDLNKKSILPNKNKQSIPVITCNIMR